MATASFLFPQVQNILPSPRRLRWVRTFNGHDVGYGGPSNVHHLFSFRPGFSGNVAVGDRITIERTAGNANYGIAVGTVSIWRGVIGNSFITPGSPSILNISLILDGDAHTLPNATFGGANDSNSTWRVISMENQIVPHLNQWYLCDLTDRSAVTGDVLTSRLGDTEQLAGLGLLMATSGSVAESNITLGILKTPDGGVTMKPISDPQVFFGVGSPTLSPPGNIGVEGSGGQNTILRVQNNNSFLNITTPAALPHFASGATRLYGYRFLPQTGRSASDTTAGSLFIGDEVDSEVLWEDGFSPPLFRNFTEESALSQNGDLIARFTTTEPAKLPITLRYFNEAQAVGAIRNLIHRCQRQRFLFSYRKSDSPVMYCWARKTSQPRFVAPTIAECTISSSGYIIYDL